METVGGTVILLNGASSSGKTSLLRAFQNLAPEPYLDMGIDKFIWMLPKRYLNQPLWSQVFEYGYSDEDPPSITSIRPGLLGDRLIRGMHRAVLALAQEGNNVVVDHVLLEERWLSDCANLFADMKAYLVGVRCPLDVLERRERERRDRTLGQARAQHERVHAYACYDLEVDTSRQSSEECAEAILAHIRNTAPAAFRSLSDTAAATNF